MIFEKEVLQKFSKHSIVAGILMVIVGTLGILIPPIMSLSAAVFFGSVLVTSSIFTAYATFKSYKKSHGAWLKSVVLFITGLLMLIFPGIGVAALGIMFSAYLLIDAFSNFTFAFDIAGSKLSALLAILNGTLSIFLGIWMIMGWPFSSIFWVGLIVGISLLFDGFELIMLGSIAKKGNF
ncbi:HdeD family acid-resistance protein [Mesoaciditoga sp.]